MRALMPVRRPRVPSGGGRRRSSKATIPTDVIAATRRASEGTGSRWAETHTREPDIGHGLPVAPKPVIATTPAEIRKREAQKREANRRRGAANNVRGYVAPAWGDRRPLPSAQALLQQTADATGQPGQMPSAEDLLHLTREQMGPSPAIEEGTYHFPQVSPTKTINPPRPRTLEAGWERITDPTDQAYPGILRVRFRDGTPWEYYGVPGDVWQRFKRVKSPGRFINRVLNSYPYGRGNF